MTGTPVAEARGAVVSACRNEAGHVEHLLDALVGQTSPPSEIIIVDDGSTDGTAERIREWQAGHPSAPVQIVAGEGRGVGPALNRGISRTTAGIIVRMDGHSVPDPDYVELCLRGVAEDGVGVVGGVWRIRAGAPTSVARAIAAVVSHPLGSGGALYRHAATAGPDRIKVETVPFGAFRRAVWERLGGFDESLVANEDFDFNYRTRRAGLDVVLDRRIKATYIARPTLRALGRQYFRYGFWKLRMLRKDPRALHWRQVPPVFLLPWALVTVVLAAIAPSLFTGLAAAAYPLVVLLGTAQIARRGARALDVLAALVTVHMCWSAGFWRGVLGGAPPGR